MLTPYPRLWDNELVPKTLVISLVMVIGQVRPEDVEKRCLPNHDHLIECFLFDGTNESLAMGVEIRAPWGQNNRLHSAALQQSIEHWRKFGVPVVDQVALAQQESVERVRQLSGAWRHEGRRRMRRDTRHVYAACGRLHHHEDVIREETVPCRHLHREEIRGGEHLPVHLQELPPIHPRLAALRGGFQVVPAGRVAGQLYLSALRLPCARPSSTLARPRALK